MTEGTEEDMMTDEVVVMMMADTEDTTITTKVDTEEVATITKIDEIILAATLISVDATEEIQIGGLHLIMILKTPLQRRQRLDLSLNFYRERRKTRLMHWLTQCKASQFSEAQNPVKKMLGAQIPGVPVKPNQTLMQQITVK